MPETKKLYRSRSDRFIGGVCGGLGEYTGVDPTIVRLLFVLGTVLTAVGLGVVAYLVLLVVVPENPNEILPPPQS
ncbi:MAG: PspC domain-containing protein [Chloroflexota bacterium]